VPVVAVSVAAVQEFLVYEMGLEFFSATGTSLDYDGLAFACEAGSSVASGATGSCAASMWLHNSPPIQSWPSFKQDRQKALRLLPSLLVMVCIHRP